jgi:ABC-2 type transport system permease protein
MDKKIFTVAKREFLERVRTRAFVLATLLVPLLMSGLILIPMLIAMKSRPSGSALHVTILDASGAGIGARVANALLADSTIKTDADSIKPRVVLVAPGELAAKEAEATAEVKLPNHIVGYLVLTDSTAKGLTARYAGRNASSISDIEKLTSVLRQEVMIHRLKTEGVKDDIVGELARNRLRVSTERLSERGRTGSGIVGILAGVMVGVLLFMSIMIHGQNIMRGVLEEKTTRVAEVVISSVKPESLLGGKVLGVGAVGLVQMAAWFSITLYMINFLGPVLLKGAGVAAAASAGAGGAPTPDIGAALSAISPGVIAIALLYFLVGFAFYGTLYAAAGSMVNSDQEAQQAAMPIMVLAISGYIFLNPVMLAPNSTLSVVLSWLPWTSPIIMPIRMGLTTVSPLSIVGSILLAALGSVFAIWLSARIYRVGMLMYGKKPSLSEVVKWVRYA